MITGTFTNQKALPRLPIPSISDTLNKYRYTLQAALTADQLNQSDKAIQASLDTLNTLQSRLIAHDKLQPYSWLEEWWYKKVYLSWRVPLLIHSNWWLLLNDTHLAHLHQNDNMRVTLPKNTYTHHQIRRAAGLIMNLVNVKLLIDNEQYPADSTKAGPLCMNQYRNVFGVTRVPMPEVDTIRATFPCTSTHIIVITKDQCFEMPTHDQNGQRLSLNQLERLLQDIVDTVSSPNFLPSLPIPILTAEQRDTWAEERAYLINLGTVNAKSIESIESSLFAVCLDDWSCTGSDLDQSLRVIAHGSNAHNRWFDKSLNVIVSANGRAGCNGEHSPQDALIPAILFEHVLANEPAQDPTGCVTGSTMDPVVHLQFTGDMRVHHYLSTAEFNNTQTIMDSDIGALVYTKYGTDFIKREAQVSPDTYVQLAMQLAYMYMYKRSVPTYETVSTRMFLHGRTETCRTLLPEVKLWTELMMTNDSPQGQQLLAAFKQAARAHATYIREGSMGKGVDRHLLGLKLVMRQDESCALFSDPAFTYSQTWQLSTSTLSPNSHKYLSCTGFGSVVHYGYGINYYSGPNQIHFGIESKRTCDTTSTDLFRVHLTKALDDLRVLVEEKSLSQSML